MSELGNQLDIGEGRKGDCVEYFSENNGLGNILWRD